MSVGGCGGWWFPAITLSQPELEKVLTFRLANLPDDIRKASQTFRIAIGLLNFFRTFRLLLSPRNWGFSDYELDMSLWTSVMESPMQLESQSSSCDQGDIKHLKLSGGKHILKYKRKILMMTKTTDFMKL